MKIKVFYSWQSDRPNSVNRSFIEEAVQLAVERINSDNTLEFEVEIAIDRDTQDIPGSPAIAETIFSKIDQCSLFLCDLTIITDKNSNRPSPNPNVLIELGYAVARIDWSRIICVMNESYGGPTKLPFDLRHRRWPITYRITPVEDETQVVKEKMLLSKDIEKAILFSIKSGVIPITINPKDYRVALKLNGALSYIVGTLASFLTNHNYEDGMKITLNDYADEPETKYPPRITVKPILSVLLANTLKSPSNVMVGEKQVLWVDVFVNDLLRTSNSCDAILNSYADREDTLISVVEDINSRSKLLAEMISISMSHSGLSTLYDNGVPKVHLEHFEYFLLSILKAYRIIRKFGVKLK